MKNRSHGSVLIAVIICERISGARWEPSYRHARREISILRHEKFHAPACLRKRLTVPAHVIAVAIDKVSDALCGACVFNGVDDLINQRKRCVGNCETYRIKEPSASERGWRCLWRENQVTARRPFMLYATRQWNHREKERNKEAWAYERERVSN